jgi:hypothetical protein
MTKAEALRRGEKRQNFSHPGFKQANQRFRSMPL